MWSNVNIKAITSQNKAFALNAHLLKKRVDF